MLPTVQRTWAPRGHRPLLWRQLKHQCRISANGLICISPFQHRLNCYHFLWPHDAIDETVIVAVLRQMRRHFRQPIILLWDRLQVHRSAFVNDDMAHAPSLDIEHFPADAPELNPVEALWSDTKQHDLAQFCVHNLCELEHAVETALERKTHDQHRIAGYSHEAERPIPWHS